MVLQTIHPDDHMWSTGREFYFQVGKNGLAAIQRAISASWLVDVRRVLDVPCGHGRVGRFLPEGFPNAKIFYCDIDQSGAEFCASTFGGTAIISKPELTEVAFPDRLDVIWIGSLFTHVDRDRTERWLSHLCGRLGPHGVLVATFHGVWAIESQRQSELISPASFAEILKQYDETGYGYAPYPGGKDFGVSLSKASTIVDIASAIAGIRIIGYQERGWANNHDVLMITKNDRLAPF